ncbi:MAG TPA: 3-oxoacyl-[acyl-carrier-protein] synthase III C-terminal domain-containing protein [Chitinispirillaceae bacterium]|nr:3-oxoacyl-[acyl-carrier-protein] synthase III C-terminal domain-containing protein [Chitinispirillaceae bacterium]
MPSNIHLASIGTSLPPCKISQEKALSLVTNYYENELTPRSISVLQKLFNHPGIKSRNFAFDDIQKTSTIKNEHPDNRVQRFTDWAVNLSSSAVINTLGPLSLKPQNIDSLIVNTCTGYICPGISSYLIEKLNLRNDTRVYDLVGTGCGGAIPNIQLGTSLAKDGQTVVCVSVEICSATFEMDNDINLLVSNSIFGDGAAAALLWNKPIGVKVVDSVSLFFPQFREHIRYIHKNGRLHNQLSSTLPAIIRDKAPEAVATVLSRNNLTCHDIEHWAIHPGGVKILNYLQNALTLTDNQIQYSRFVLEKNGNMSSPTVLFILKDILNNGNVNNGDWGIVMAFGAGLSIYTLLLHWENK